MMITKGSVVILSFFLSSLASPVFGFPWTIRQASSVSTIKESSSLLAQTDRTFSEADRLLEQGIQQYQSGNPLQALESFQRALQLYQGTGDQRKIVRTLRNFGNVYYVVSQDQKALDYFQQSLTLARQIQDREGEAAGLGNMGAVYAKQGNYTQAQLVYQQALTLYQEISDRLGEGQMLGNLGEVFAATGDSQKAIQVLQQAINLARELSNKRLEANSVGMLSIIYYQRSDYVQAIAFAQQQRQLAQQLNDPFGESAAFNNLGSIYTAMGNYGQALTYLEQRLTLSRKIQDRLGEVQALQNFAAVYSELGDYQKAIAYAVNALDLARQLKNTKEEAGALTELGNLYWILQDFPQAIAYHQQRLTLAESMNDPNGKMVALNNLGNVYKVMGQYPQAIAYHQQALTLSRQLQNRAGESSALVNLGVEHDELGKSAQALDYYRQALALARSIQDRATEGLILNNLGNTYFKTQQLTEAAATLREGLQVWETVRASLGESTGDKVNLFEQQARTYRLLQRALVAQKQTDAALEIAERGRSRAFVELLSRRLAANPGAKVLAETMKAPTLAQIQAIAKSHQATLVEYALTYEDIVVNQRVQPREAELYIWVIAPTGKISFRQVNLTTMAPSGTPLADLVTRSREAMGLAGRGVGVVARSGSQAPREPLQNLYQWLIQPIADLLPTDSQSRIIFIPQGALFLVPFAALQDAQGQYLIDSHTLAIAPSIQVLDLTQQQQLQHSQGNPSPGRILTPALVVGNPTMPKLPAPMGENSESLSPLPGAEQEAQAIAPLLGSQAITGQAATKVAIVQQMGQARLIHLATHGLLDDVKGMGVPGALALASSGQDSGLLTADEILDLKLQAELVVLSACDTGRGRITGDGIIGLSRSFITAGVPSLVVSLWAVPDFSTAFLMTEFYRNLKQGQDKAQALRQAMLATKQQYPDPLQWAAFTLIGEAD